MKQVNEVNIKRDAQRILRALKYLKPLKNDMVETEQGYKVSVYEQLNDIEDAIQQILGEIGAAHTIESSRKIVSAEEDTHPEFRKLSDEDFNELKGPVEDALDELMLKKHFGLDKEVYDETVKYIIEMFGEDSLKPSDAKAAVADWYNDTKQFFPEMFGKGEKRKIASAAYLKKIRSSRCIKSSKKPIKSTYQFVCEFDGRHHPRVITEIGKENTYWDDADEDYGNAKNFTDAELHGAVNTIRRIDDYSDIDIVRDDGESVSVSEFLKHGSFDKAWEEAVKNDDKWFED